MYRANIYLINLSHHIFHVIEIEMEEGWSNRRSISHVIEINHTSFYIPVLFKDFELPETVKLLEFHHSIPLK